jgi:hypothetical protein
MDKENEQENSMDITEDMKELGIIEPKDDTDMKIYDFSELKEEAKIETAKFTMPSINNESVNNEMSTKTDDSQISEGNPENEENIPDLIENDPIPSITSEELNKEKLQLVHKKEDIKIEGYNTEIGLNRSSDKTEFVGEGEAKVLEEDNGDYEGNVVVSVTEAQLIQQKSHLVHKATDIKIEGYTHDSEEDINVNTSSDTEINQSSVLGTNVDSDTE